MSWYVTLPFVVKKFCDNALKNALFSIPNTSQVTNLSNWQYQTVHDKLPQTDKLKTSMWYSQGKGYEKYKNVSSWAFECLWVHKTYNKVLVVSTQVQKTYLLQATLLIVYWQGEQDGCGIKKYIKIHECTENVSSDHIAWGLLDINLLCEFAVLGDFGFGEK